MKEEILVSVIIPTYNRLEYFKIALDSALNQTYRNLEVIVTDDSSIDDIENYVRTIDDGRIKYFRNRHRLGIALNVKNGIEKSSGDYFAFLNDDDLWMPSFLEKLCSAALSNNAGCIFSDHLLINNKGIILEKETLDNSKFYKRNELDTGIVSNKKIDLFIDFSVPVAMACMIKKDMINLADYPHQVGGAYDRWLLLQCVANKNCTFYYVNEKLTNYRVHDLSVSSTQGVTVATSVIYILSIARKKLALSRQQLKFINSEIRSYIRSLIKKKSLIFLRYVPAYLASYLN
jgi:glycosyltransferase involved in cell wall biosynthesis